MGTMGPTMTITRTRIIIGAVALVALAAVAFLAYLLIQSNGEARARIVATEFVQQMQNVPLTAEAEEVTAAIRQYYAPYVTPELLDAWIADPATAPGRAASSPWPDRIFIKSVTEQGASFAINADVLYVTSVEAESPEEDAAGVMVVTMLVTRTDDGYRISAFEELFGEGLDE